MEKQVESERRPWGGRPGRRPWLALMRRGQGFGGAPLEGRPAGDLQGGSMLTGALKSLKSIPVDILKVPTWGGVSLPANSMVAFSR